MSKNALVFIIGAAFIVPGLIYMDTRVGPWLLGFGAALFLGGIALIAAGKGNKKI